MTNKWNWNFLLTNKVRYVASYYLFLLALSLSINKQGWGATWKFLGIPSMSPSFADMRTIQGGLYSSDSGLDPQMDNPGDPWFRTMNYPRIWLGIARTFNFGSEQSFILWNITISLCFVLTCTYILINAANFTTFFLLISGSSLLALERGNNDLLIFVLLATSLIFGGISRYLNLLLSVILKIYPIFVIPFQNFKSKEKATLLVLAGVYLFVIRNELSNILSGNSAGGPLSYGVKSTSVLTRDYIQSFFGFEIPVALLAFSMVVLLLLLTNIGRKIYIEMNASSSLKFQELFVLGASVYCTTFLISANWDYRLIFLALCMPWVHSQVRKTKVIIVILMLLSSNYLLLDLALPNPVAVLLSVAAKNFLFVVLLLVCWKLSSNRVKSVA